MFASLYLASISLVMFFSVQALLRFGAPSEFGPLGARLSEAICYVLSVVFFAAFVIETGRVLGS